MRRADVPMPLGDHLEELRRRILRVILVLGGLSALGFLCANPLKQIVLQPLVWALASASTESKELLGLPIDAETGRLLRADSFAESPLTAVRVSFLFAFAVAIPHLIYEAWCFVVPALKRPERQLGFLFVPAAVLFFYAGVVLGYCYGMPLLYQWLIEYTAQDPTAVLELRQSQYISFFTAMTVVFGMVMDIPWLVLVLIRVGLVSPQQMAASRRYVIFGAVVAAAILTPPDPMSQIFLFVPMVLLFEAGLLVGRLLYGDRHER